MKVKKSKVSYYSLKNILEYNAKYNVIFGERSNGKTYAALLRGIERYVKYGEQFAIVRRWREDFTGKRGATYFDNLINNQEIEKLTNGEWNNVYYFSSRWYFCRYDDEGKRITDDEPFAYGFAVTASEHDKSTSYPRIKTVIFDEFITRTGYTPNEFVLFMNTLSTIIRERDDVVIFMLGNTVNQYCPYFHEMGLEHVQRMKPGTIDLYHYGDSNLTVAVEYTAPTEQGKPSDVYFAFNNPKLEMITSGAWELDIYPHCPIKYAPKDICYIFFIKFERQTLQCEVVRKENKDFIYIHKKTGEIKDPDDVLIYCPEWDPRPNFSRRITRPANNLQKKITAYFANDKVFYQNNEIGDLVWNYLKWCSTERC